MTTWQFYLVLDQAELTDTDCDAIYAAGCDDGTVVSRDGVTYIAFDREADSLNVAVYSAAAQLLDAGFAVARAEVDEADEAQGLRRVLWSTEDLLQEELARYLYHFVALSGCYHQIDSSGSPTEYAGAFHYSGFILEVNEHWYWTTAAHVFCGEERGIETRRRRGEIEIDRCALNDSFTASGQSWTPIPFSYWQFDPIRCYDDAQGLDICALRLRDNYRRLLEASGVVALSEEDWQHDELSTYDHFLLIGLPAELEDTKVKHEIDGYEIKTKPTPAAVYVTRVDDIPADYVKPTPRFVGIVQKRSGDIKGMSGGPIFGFRLRQGDPRHYLVAVQSSWLPRRGLIFGCPVSVLVQKLMDQDRIGKGNTEPQV